MNGLVTRNTWFHILAGLMTVGLKLANYLMCLRGFFIILLSISGLFGFSYCFVLGKEKVKLLPGASDTWLDIHSENKTSSFYNSNSAGTIDFSFFLLVYVYWLFLIHCVLSWDFEEESSYSMDSKSLFTAKKCLRSIQKQGASMNGYTVWIFSFYPIFFRWFLCLKKCNASD